MDASRPPVRRLEASSRPAALLAAITLLISGAARADTFSVRAHVDPEAGIAEGTFRWTVVNEGDTALTFVQLFLYPRIYRDDPALDDVLEPRVYPVAFDPGDQELLCSHADVASDRVPGLPLARIDLREPLAPGAATTVECGFRTTIPLRYGSFGHFRDVLTTSGGLTPLPVTRSSDGRWLHQAPPPPMEQDLVLDLPEGWGAVAGGTLQGFEGASFVADALPRRGRRRWLPVQVRRTPVRQNIPLDDGHCITWVGSPLRTRQKRWIRLAVQDARETLREAGLPAGRGVVLVEAPMRRFLVEPSDGVILVSDRFLEVADPFWRYHDLHLARAVMAEQLADVVDAREDPLHAPTTLHGVSWELVPRYLARRWRGHVGLKQILERLRFLPAIDDLLETPVFPFADQVYDDPWVVDPIKADVTRFNRPLRSGRVLFLELEDLVGEQTLARAVDAYVAGGPSDPRDFWTLLLERSGIDARPHALRWLEPPGRVNLRLDEVRRRREGKAHVTTVLASRQVLVGGPPDIPVEVRLDPASPGKKGRITLKWQGRDEVATWEVRSAGRVGAVRIDPRGRVLEVDEQGVSLARDNRLPRAVTVTGFGYVVALDLTGRGLEAYGALGFRPEHDTRHHVLARIYTDPETAGGAGLSYVRYFGRPRAGSYRRNRLVAAVDAQWLAPRFRPTGVPFVVEASASYVYETRSATYFPTRGGRFEARVFGGKDIALQGERLRPLLQTSFAGMDLLGVALIRLHPWQVIALRARLGLVAGNVAHREFNLGGLDGLRGIPLEHVTGAFRAIGTVEWRHFFFRDRELRLPLFRLRGMQGGLFVEAGMVADDLSVGPRPGEMGVSIGYGLRFYGDWFGLLPAVGGVEIAWSPGAPDGRVPVFDVYERWPRVPFQIYLVGSQSF